MKASSSIKEMTGVDLFSLPAQPVEGEKPVFVPANGSDLPALVYLAHRIRLSHSYDKLSSLSNSRTRLLPHQIEATHRVCSALRPRFLLADEVGLGKTIEAGLVMKELMLRKGYRRILVTTPATLTIQWQNEMRTRFNEEFLVMNRANFNSVMAQAAKSESIRIITSIDFIKNEKYNEKILKMPWDMAVFDEAHRLRRDDNKITQGYQFADQIASRVDALLLLSATPFRGKLEELYYLIHLLDPHLLGPKHSFYNEYVIPSRNGESVEQLRTKLEKILIRRRKVEVGGFTRRIARTVRFDLSPEERAFYDATTEYVKREYNIAMSEKNRAVGFVMIVFQKLLDSSTRALLRALEKRKAMLEMRMHRTASFAERLVQEEDDFMDSLDSIEDEEYLVELAEELGGDDRSVLQKNLNDFRKEILTLSRLIQLGRRIRVDRKVVKLKEAVDQLRKKGHKKFIIFTQFRTTQEYLAEALEGYRVVQFHGSLNVKQKEDAIETFKRDDEVLICTEAGGEGRNLQFADILVNYDLPWSPLKIEQRIGRIHRFGQKNDCLILNFCTRDTVAERVIEVLEQKIRLFEESIGPSDMLLGTVEDDLRFSRSLMDFISGRIGKNDFDEGLEERVSRARDSYNLLNQLVAPRFVDFNLNDYYRYTRRERRLDNGLIEDLVLRFLKIVPEGRFRLERLREVELLPDDREQEIVRAEQAEQASRKGRRQIEERRETCTVYRLHDLQTKTSEEATFDSDYALQNERLVFLAAGHPLIEQAIDYFMHHPERRTQLTVKRRRGLQPGLYLTWVIHYRSGLQFTDLAMSFRPAGGSDGLPDAEPAITILDRLPFEDDERLLPEMLAVHPAEIEACRKIVSEHALHRGQEVRRERNGLFRSEESKIEISYGKKIRQLEEKKDIERMRAAQNPVPERKAVLTRTENELIKARQEMQLQLSQLKAEARIEFDLELLQIYVVV